MAEQDDQEPFGCNVRTAQNHDQPMTARNLTEVDDATLNEILRLVIVEVVNRTVTPKQKPVTRQQSWAEMRKALGF